MLLTLLSYALGAGTALLLTLCLANALMQVCEWIEEHPVQSRKIGRRVSQTCAGAVCLITLTDHLPRLFLVTSLAAHTLVGLSFDARRWSSMPTVPRVIVHCTASALPHWVLLHRFHPLRHSSILHDVPHPDYHDKPTLPGGRIDWDAYPSMPRFSATRLYGGGEQLACFALCWLPTVWAILMAIADNWTLPLTHERAAKSSASSKRMT